VLRQVKQEAPCGDNSAQAHGIWRPTPIGEAHRWACWLLGPARLCVRARPLFFVALLLALGELARHSDLSLNLSPSLPRGVYLRTREPLLRGSLVLLCLPVPWAALALERGYLARGPCPGGSEPLGKIVGALSGDEVEWADEGLRVNGKLLPKTAPLFVDSRGRFRGLPGPSDAARKARALDDPPGGDPGLCKPSPELR
jgi:conjugative transfer signal peptidase TraF